MMILVYQGFFYRPYHLGIEKHIQLTGTVFRLSRAQEVRG